MGICASCLGLRRRGAETENAETSRLLYDDAYQRHYGSHLHNGQRTAYQPDPEHLKREREALEGICHAMSENVIDVFTILPQTDGRDTSRPTSSEAFTNGVNGHTTPSESIYRSVKRGRIGAIITDLKEEEEDLKDIKEVMG
ncbi:MAG: hypothetical protein LQ347_002133 [Umbilicaria vellea]|nr:MAG: hypothetical protein LQ347_002133 [Umbilicaria vellea]